MSSGSQVAPPSVARVVILGSGRAGLAMAYALLRRGLKPQTEFILIANQAERQREDLGPNVTFGDVSLPGIPPRGDRKKSLTRADIADYFESYAAQLGVEPIRSREVSHIRVDDHGHGLHVMLDGREVSTRNVVITTASEAYSMRDVIAGPGVFSVKASSGRGALLRSSRLGRETARIARAIAARP